MLRGLKTSIAIQCMVGDLTGSANPTPITMNGNKTVGAAFVLLPPTQYILTIGISGSGTVAKSPDNPSYVNGTQVTLTAAPSGGWTFGNWSGDLSGTANPAAITMNGNKSVTAVFIELPVITAQPANQTVTVGQTATFTVADHSSARLPSIPKIKPSGLPQAAGLSLPW